MNEVILKGQIRDITSSHVIGGIEYDKANIITTRADGKEDILSLKFKRFSNVYSDGDNIELVGNLRSYSRKLDNDTSKVDLYVFTYFDTPSTDLENYADISNQVTIDGRICKIDKLRTTKNGKNNIHFILANNIISFDQKLNNYIPSVAWGKLALSLADLRVSDKVQIKGQLHSRTYKKILPDGELELRTAHELVVNELEVLNERNI